MTLNFELAIPFMQRIRARTIFFSSPPIEPLSNIAKKPVRRVYYILIFNISRLYSRNIPTNIKRAVEGFF